MLLLLHSRATVITGASIVCRSSVKPVLSEPVQQINAIFDGKVPFHHISRPFFFFFSQFCIFGFLWISFVFVNMGLFGRKNQKTSPLKVHNRITKQLCILLWRVSTKLSKDLQFLFIYLFSFSFTWNYMGEKNCTTDLLPHIQAYSPRKGFYQSCIKNCEISKFRFLEIYYLFIYFCSYFFFGGGCLTW